MQNRNIHNEPTQIKLHIPIGKIVLALGPEMNSTACLLKDGEAYVTPPVGSTENLQNMERLKDSIGCLLDAAGTKYEDIDIIACDMHPRFNTTRLAEGLSEKFDIPQVSIQHHHAHIASVMAEHGLDEIVGIAADGVGYGTDSAIWGGEVLVCRGEKFKRAGHLKEQFMPGGDMATRFPLRMLAGILHSRDDLREILLGYKGNFLHGEKEIDVVLGQLEKNINVAKTTSCGRVLDCLSALLGICFERTYEGEPAIKLEGTALSGKANFDFPVIVRRGVLDTTQIVETALELKNAGNKIEDIAASAQKALADGLSEIAVGIARGEGIKKVGMSGGVAYNKAIVGYIGKNVEKAGLKFVTNSRVPCGDGGVSLGQALVGAFLK